MQDLQRLDLYLCIGVIAASLALKKYRKPVLFATAVYLGNIYIYAMTYSFSRYNASLMSMRFSSDRPGRGPVDGAPSPGYGLTPPPAEAAGPLRGRALDRRPLLCVK